MKSGFSVQRVSDWNGGAGARVGAVPVWWRRRPVSLMRLCRPAGLLRFVQTGRTLLLSSSPVLSSSPPFFFRFPFSSFSVFVFASFFILLPSSSAFSPSIFFVLLYSLSTHHLLLPQLLSVSSSAFYTSSPLPSPSSYFFAFLLPSSVSSTLTFLSVLVLVMVFYSSETCLYNKSF